MGVNSVAVNATFLLSGMLGLQLQLPDGNGNFKSVETSLPFSSSPEVSFQSTSENVTTTMITMQRMGKAIDVDKVHNCGNSDCKLNEKCVTWQRDNDTRGSNSVKECMVDDGRYSTKTNPHATKLCGPRETHSLIISEPEPCLGDDPPCDIVWKYKCVKEDDSPHSCKTRKCPPNFLCLELVHCERYPPCITATECHHISEVDHFRG